MCHRVGVRSRRTVSCDGGTGSRGAPAGGEEVREGATPRRKRTACGPYTVERKRLRPQGRGRTSGRGEPAGGWTLRGACFVSPEAGLNSRVEIGRGGWRCRNRMKMATRVACRWPIERPCELRTKAIAANRPRPSVCISSGEEPQRQRPSGLANYPFRLASRWPFIAVFGHLQSIPPPSHSRSKAIHSSSSFNIGISSGSRAAAADAARPAQGCLGGPVGGRRARDD